MSTPKTPPPPAPAVASLLAELVAEGTVHSEGSFSLDREKAREKMRQFQLADPLEYLLQWVRAAVLQGATGLEFTIDTDDMWLSFDGNPFTIEDFDELYGALFGRAEDPSLAARRHLALGVNAALALEPRHLRIDSGAAHLLVRPGENDAFGPLDPPHAKTRIHVRNRFKLSHFGRFFRAARGTLPERTLLAARAAFCPVPLTVNAIRLDTGFDDLKGRTTTWIELVEGPHRVLGGHGRPGPEPEPDQVILVAAGVSIRTRTLAGADGFTAVATAAGLRTDVSQADVVQDAVFEALMAVVERARLRSLGALLEAHPDEAPTRLRRELEHAAPPDGWAAHYGPQLAGLLRNLPVWPTLGGRLRSTAEVEASDFSFVSDGLASQFAALDLEPPAAWASTLLLPEVPLGGTPPPAGRALFDRWFGPRAQDRTAALERFLTGEKNRRSWQRRFVDTRLPGEGWLARQGIEAGEIHGEIGIHPSLSERSVLRFAVQGRLLAERVVTLPLPGFEALLHGPFAPTELFDDVQAGDVLSRALDAVAAALPALLDDLATRHPTQAVAVARAWLHLACDGDPVAITRAALVGEKPLQQPPPAWLTALPESGAPLAGLPLFQTSEGHPLSLADLAALRRAGHTIRHIAPGRPPLAVDPPLVATGADDLELLKIVFGFEALSPGNSLYAEAEQRATFLAQPPTFPHVGFHRGTVVGRVVVEAGGFRGEVALRFDRERSARDGCYRMPVQLWVGGRPVSVIEVPTPLPGLVAALEHPDFKADFAFRAVTFPPTDWPLLGAPLGAGLRMMLTTHDTGGLHLRLVRMLIDLVVPTDAHHTLWTGLHRTRSRAEAEARYLDVLRAGWGGDAEQVAKALEANPDGPLPAARAEAVAFTEALLGPHFFQDPEGPPLERILAAVPAVGRAPVFSTVDGHAVTLHQLALIEKPLLHALLARSRPQGYSGPVLLGSGPAVAQLRRLFGPEALISASEWSKASAAARVVAALPLHSGRLDRSHVFAVHTLPGGGEVGLRRPFTTAESRLRVVCEGRLAGELDVHLSARVEAVVVDNTLELGVAGGQVRIPGAVRDGLAARVEGEVPGLLTSLVAALPTLTAEDAASARAHVRSALVQRVREKARRADNLSGDPLVVTLANVELFQEVGGPRRSLLEVTRQREARQPIWLTDGPPEAPPEEGSMVLQVDAAERDDLKALFGLVLPEYADQVAATHREVAFQKQPQRDAVLPGVIAQVPVQKGAFSGLVGLGGPGEDRLEVHRNNRLVGVTRLALGVVGLSAVVNDDQAELADGAEGRTPREGPRLDKLRVAVAERVPALVAAALEAPGDGSALRSLVWSLLRCAVPTATWAQLYHAAVDWRGAGAGTVLYHDALRCLFQDTPRTLDKLVKPLGFKAEKLMLAEGGPRHGRGDAFVRALFGDWPLTAPGEGLVGRLLAQQPVLGRIPLVPTAGGAWRTLAELAAMPGRRPYRLRGIGGDAAVLVPPPVHWSWLEAVFPDGWAAAGSTAAPPRVEPPATVFVVHAPPAPERPTAPPAPALTPAPAPAPEPAPAPAPAPEPAPEPEPAPIPPPAQLLERIHEILRGLHLELDLGRVQIADGDGRAPTREGPQGVVIDARHPLVQRALAGRDPVWDCFVATAVFGALNRLLGEVTDAHEADLVLRLAAQLAGRR